jgi:hypothetical protein
MPSLKPCIFCGRFDGLSKEHIWPRWMAAYLPIGKTNAHVSEVRSGIPKQPSTLKQRSERPGPVHTKKVRAVCRRCNSGWMSSIEEEAKPMLQSALTSTEWTVSSKEAQAIARWAILKAIVCEHASLDHLTPQEDRNVLRLHLEVPAYFRVFIARHSGELRAAYLRHSATFSRSLEGLAPPLSKNLNRNVQITTILVGPLCFHITAIRVDGVPSSLLDPVRRMHQLHPGPYQLFAVNELPLLADLDMHLNSQAIDRIMNHPKVMYGGELPFLEPASTTQPLKR